MLLGKEYLKYWQTYYLIHTEASPATKQLYFLGVGTKHMKVYEELPSQSLKSVVAFLLAYIEKSYQLVDNNLFCNGLNKV